jgi:hypothetical protein
MDLLQSGYGKLQIAPEPITFQGQHRRGDANSQCRIFDTAEAVKTHQQHAS